MFEIKLTAEQMQVAKDKGILQELINIALGKVDAPVPQPVVPAPVVPAPVVPAPVVPAPVAPVVPAPVVPVPVPQPVAPVPVPQPVAPAPVAAPVAPGGHTIEEVRAVLTNLLKTGKKDQVNVLLAKYGAAKLSDLQEAYYGTVIAEAAAL